MTTVIGAGATDGDIPVWDDASSSWLSAQIESGMVLSDVTTGNASLSAHGFESKLSGNGYDLKRGDGAWAPLNGVAGPLFYSWDYLLGSLQVAPWGYAGAITSGTTTYIPSIAGHPGICTFLSSASANGGYTFHTGATSVLLAGGEQSNFIFRLPTVTAIVIHLGFSGVWTAAAATQKVGIAIAGNQLTGAVCAAGAPVNTATAYTVSTNTWYRANIAINAGYTAATFTVWTCADQTQVWQATCTVGTDSAVLPSAATGHGLSAWQTSAGNTTILQLDYIDLTLPATLAR